MRYPTRGTSPHIHHYQSGLYRVPHRETWFCNGSKTDVQSSQVTIWQSNLPYIPQATAQKLNIVSSSAADSAAGANARTIIIEGIDKDGRSIGESRALNGLAPVASISEYLSVQQMYVAVAGATGATAGNAGNITATYQTTGNVAAVIPTGKCIQQHSHFRVPPGYEAILKQVHVSSWLINVLLPMRQFSVSVMSDNSSGSSLVVREAHIEYMQKQTMVFEPAIYLDEMESAVITATANSAAPTGVYTRMGFLLSKKGVV